MLFFKKLFNFYINSSIHVAFSAYSLVRLTQCLFQITNENQVVYFAFFGTIVGYNFVKYDALARVKKQQMSKSLKSIAILSFFSLLIATYCFFQLKKITQIIGVIFLLITLLYTLPFFPNKKNARNWAGIKIYIVALCWVGVTVWLPIINSGIAITTQVFQVSVQRFLLIFVLILIFEIIDLQTDDPHLKTVPQQIGIKKTKIVGTFLLLLFIFLELLKSNSFRDFSLIKLGISLSTFIFLFYANEKKSKYYTSFWVESIPIIWYICLKIIC